MITLGKCRLYKILWRVGNAWGQGTCQAGESRQVRNSLRKLCLGAKGGEYSFNKGMIPSAGIEGESG